MNLPCLLHKWLLLKDKIVKIIPQDSIIIMKNGYVKIDDILKVRRAKGKAGKIIGAAIMSAGPGIMVFGTLGGLADGGEKKISGWPALIGAVVTGVGWLISKTGRRKKYTSSKHTRLKIYDIRWVVPEEVVKPKA